MVGSGNLPVGDYNSYQYQNIFALSQSISYFGYKSLCVSIHWPYINLVKEILGTFSDNILKIS